MTPSPEPKPVGVQLTVKFSVVLPSGSVTVIRWLTAGVMTSERTPKFSVQPSETGAALVSEILSDDRLQP
jgi:hypothetical protein